MTNRGASRFRQGFRRFVAPYWRQTAAALTLLVGLGYFLAVVATFHPLSEWWSWRFIGYGAATSFWALGCLSLGIRVDALLRPRLRLSERLVMAFSSGVVAFSIVLFVVGLFGWLIRPMFVILPAICLAAGARPAFRLVRRADRHVRAARRRGVRPDTLAERAALVAGIVGVSFLLVPTATVAHIGFDSGWYHIPVAEHYAALGRITAFKEGWYLGAYPRLAGLLYTWAELCPWGDPVDRVMLAGTVEVAVFFATLASITVLVRATVGRGVRYAWAALFLFPITFITDLEIAADHVGALFAAPILIGFLRYYPTLDPARGVLLAGAMAGALGTKYTAMPMVVAPVLGVAVLAVTRSLRRLSAGGGLRGAWNAGFGSATTTAATLLALLSPYWLSNLIWYGDPIYPLAHHFLRPRIWTPTSGRLADFYFHELGTFHPPRTWYGLGEAALALPAFSFRVFEFWNMHYNWPFIGSVFTIVTLALPFVRVPRRVWLLFAFAYVTVFVWYMQSYVERYLHTPLPLFAAAAASGLVLVRRTGRVARIAALAVIVAQTLWSLSVIGLPNMQRKLEAASQLAKSAYLPEKPDLGFGMRGWVDIGRSLPPRARPLLHETWGHVGLERAAVSDITGSQGGIAYGLLPDARAVHSLMKKLRVTHLVSPGQSNGDDSLAGDLRYWDYERRFGQIPRQLWGYRIVEVPDEPPPPEAGDDLTYVHTCKPDDPYVSGLYPLSALNRAHLGSRWHGETTPPLEPPAADPTEQVSRARYAVVRTDCPGTAPRLVAAHLAPLPHRGVYALYGPRASHRQ